MSIDKIYKYERISFRDGKEIHREITSIKAEVIYFAFRRCDIWAFRDMLKLWNVQGNRKNIGGMTYQYNEIST